MLVSTAVLEEGVEMPSCTLIVRFDAPLSYQSYVQSAGRIRPLASSHLYHLVEADQTEGFVRQLATYATYNQVKIVKLSVILILYILISKLEKYLGVRICSVKSWSKGLSTCRKFIHPRFVFIVQPIRELVLQKQTLNE